MDLKLKTLESVISMDYPAEVALPPVWQVIYDEGVRGHHLLFTVEDIAAFESEPYVSDKSLSQEHASAIENTAIALLSAPSLTRMRDVVAMLSMDCRGKVYWFYRYLLGYWNQHLKINLN